MQSALLAALAMVALHTASAQQAKPTQWTKPDKPIGLYCVIGDTINVSGRGRLYASGCFSLVRDGPGFHATGYLARYTETGSPTLVAADRQLIDGPASVFDDGAFAIELNGENIGGFLQDGEGVLAPRKADQPLAWWNRLRVLTLRTAEETNDERLEPDGVYAAEGNVGSHSVHGQVGLVRTGEVSTVDGTRRCIVRIQVIEDDGVPLRSTLDGTITANGTLVVASSANGLKGRGTIRAGHLELDLVQDLSPAMQKSVQSYAKSGEVYVRTYRIQGAKLVVPHEK